MDDIQKILEIWNDGCIGKLISPGGSPAYNFALTAKGAHTAYIIGNKNQKPDPWDYSSGTMLVRNAGGQVTDVHGNDIDPLTHSSYIVASTNPFVHEQLLGFIQKYKIGE